ncbi:MAG: hypothetical protein Q8P41_09275 [Pseudomonadota bacterium]|nr:hypothetical protein [Pseudomonadota bacterium]
MLYLDAPEEIERVTLFRDYASPRRYYYLPASPRLVVEQGEPRFELLLYRRDITDNPLFQAGDRPGGGFLTMTVDLGVPQARLDAIRAKLAARGAEDVDLVPVPVDSGSVRVTTLGAESGAGADSGGPARHFVERILGSGKPSLYGDNRAVFSIELDHEGATLLKRSLEDEGATQIAVVYELTYTGLLPAYEVHIEIDAAQVYHHLRDRFRVNTLFFKSDVDRELEELRQSQHIRIREVSYLVLDPATVESRRAALQVLVKELATFAYFKPGLKPGAVLAADRGGDLVAADPTAAAAAITAGFSTPLRAAISGDPANAPGATMVAGTSDRSGGIGGTNPTATATAAASPPAADTIGISPAVAAWNAAGRPQATWQVRELTQTEVQDLRFDLTQVSATTRTIAPQGSIAMLPGASKMAGRIKEVDLNNPFFDRLSGAVGSTADLASVGVSSMVVKVRYGFRDDGTFPKDTAEFVVTQAGTAGSYAFFLDRRYTLQQEYQLVVRHKPGFAIGDTATESETPWIRTTDRNLDVDPAMAASVFNVRLAAASVDWTAVRSVEAVVRYLDAEAGIDAARTVRLDRDTPDAVVPVRPKDRAKDRFEVMCTWRYAEVEETILLAGRGDSLVLLHQPTGRAVPIRVELRDPLARYARATVELGYTPAGSPEQRSSLDLTADLPRATWTLHRPGDSRSAEAPVTVRYRVTLFSKDDTTTVLDWRTTTERQLLVGDVFAPPLVVKVRLIGGVNGDLAQSGYTGCRLTLTFADAAPGVDDREQLFLEGKPAVVEWRVPRLRVDADRWAYKAEFLGSDGQIRAVAGESTDELFLLSIPRADGQP